MAIRTWAPNPLMKRLLLVCVAAMTFLDNRIAGQCRVAEWDLRARFFQGRPKEI